MTLGPSAPSAREVWDAAASDPDRHDLSVDDSTDDPLADPAGSSDDQPGPSRESHRGAFGEFGGTSDAFIERTFRERIVLVGVQHDGQSIADVEVSLDELALLVDTAGADPVARLVQRRHRPEPATFIGKGKVAELATLAAETDCDTVVFDDELTPAQQRNLEKILGRTAIDRTAVILDIFAQNATSQAGKAQVELALLQYRLPRLRGQGKNLSQQGGGIGTRMGGGETKLEVDRRRILRRIHRLEADLRTLGAHRATQAKARARSRNRHVAIVGYTNAGKSTLLNRLTDAGVLSEDRLFATLDATTRRFTLPGGETLLCTDTVGFVRKLPHGLVEAFRSTLDVVLEADLLVHLVDASLADPLAQFHTVRDVLTEIGAGDIPEIIAVNKIDACDDETRHAVLTEMRTQGRPVVAFSAKTGEGVDDLVAEIADQIRNFTDEVVLYVPYSRPDRLAALHREGVVVTERPDDTGVLVTARLEPSARGPFEELIVERPR